MTREIDRQLLALHNKLRATTNIVVRHRLVREIDRLLDERLKHQSRTKHESLSPLP